MGGFVLEARYQWHSRVGETRTYVDFARYGNDILGSLSPVFALYVYDIASEGTGYSDVV
jgi:hypothetical protein